MATHELPQEAIKLMVDLSTAHMAHKDTRLCSKYADDTNHGAANGLPRMIWHAYGYLVFVDSDPEITQSRLAAMRDAGFSEAFCDLYNRAASSENPIYLINFDRDGEVIETLPVFTW